MKARLLALALLATGCTVTPADVGASPSCPQGNDDVPDTVVLIAQAVPTAALVPCVGTLPSGWTVPELQIESSYARIVLAGDVMGTEAVRVELTESCEVEEASSVPSDRDGTTRYDAADGSADLQGTRRYVFDGGCATYTYDLRSTDRDVPVDDALLAVSLLPRAMVNQSVRLDHDNRVGLDPS
jgi:hypothetical protein